MPPLAGPSLNLKNSSTRGLSWKRLGLISFRVLERLVGAEIANVQFEVLVRCRMAAIRGLKF